MRKGQGYASIGAILLAGAMFRGSLSSDPSQTSNGQRESTMASAEKSATGEGPWLASCHYWAAVRLAPSPAAKTTPQLNIDLTQKETNFDAAVKDLSMPRSLGGAFSGKSRKSLGMWWPETGSVSLAANGIYNLQILKGAESAKSARMPKRSCKSLAKFVF
jgi:hypothetical protein